MNHIAEVRTALALLPVPVYRQAMQCRDGDYTFSV
jgi:hypothetical protein